MTRDEWRVCKERFASRGIDMAAALKGTAFFRRIQLMTDPITASRDLVLAITAERDEADRRAGAAAREMADLRDTVSRQAHWRYMAKQEAGYHDNVSFDTVWAETLGMARAADALRAENARLAASEPTCAVVKPLEWVETWSGGDEDIPSWHAQNVLGLHVRFSFSGRLVNGNHILTHSEAPDAWVAKAKAAEESKYAARILSAITLRPEAEVRAEAWAAAIEAAANAAHDRTPEKHGGAPLAAHCTGASIENAIRAMITDDASAALDRIKAEAKAEGWRAGMQEAIEISENAIAKIAALKGGEE